MAAESNKKQPLLDDDIVDELHMHGIVLIVCLQAYKSRHNLERAEKADKLFDPNCVSELFRITEVTTHLGECVECCCKLLVSQVSQTLAADYDAEPGSCVYSQNGYELAKGETIKKEKYTDMIIRVYPYPGDGGCKCSRYSKPDSDIRFMNLTDRFDPNNKTSTRTHFDQLRRDAGHSQREKFDEIQRYTGVYYDKDEMMKLLSFNPNIRRRK